MKTINTKTLLLRGTSVWLYSDGLWWRNIVAEKDIEYEHGELKLLPYGPGQDYYSYDFQKPYPIYEGKEIDSIGWMP